MKRVSVVHWKVEEAGPLLETLRAAGYDAQHDRRPFPKVLRGIREAQPDAVVIDLSRVPSHGRELAVELRGSKTARHIPIVFVNGEEEKVEAIRALLPDAVYTTQGRLKAAVRQALASPVTAPVVPKKMMDRFASRTVAQKLGIREGCSVGLVDPPVDYRVVLGDFPPGVTVEEEPAAPLAVTLWFIRDAHSYRSRLGRMRQWAARTKLWVIWPKGAERADTGIDSNVVRESGIEVGLVDYKICSVNAVWSAMAFAAKKG